MKQFGIIITIYKRKDGLSPFYLKRCIDSIENQLYKNFKIFVIGDYYKNDDEIKKIIPNHYYYENLPYAKERSKYKGKKLWVCGGLNATLHGINMVLNNNIDYLILLDYDDYWSINHLLEFNTVSFDIAFTKSTYKNKYLPKYSGKNSIIKMLPKSSNVIKSSVCYNIKTIPIFPRNMIEEENKIYPSDADMWNRMSVYIINNNLKSIFINKLTCYHDIEGYSIKESSE